MWAMMPMFRVLSRANSPAMLLLPFRSDYSSSGRPGAGQQKEDGCRIRPRWSLGCRASRSGSDVWGLPETPGRDPYLFRFGPRLGYSLCCWDELSDTNEPGLVPDPHIV